MYDCEELFLIATFKKFMLREIHAYRDTMQGMQCFSLVNGGHPMSDLLFKVGFICHFVQKIPPGSTFKGIQRQSILINIRENGTNNQITFHEN